MGNVSTHSPSNILENHSTRSWRRAPAEIDPESSAAEFWTELLTQTGSPVGHTTAGRPLVAWHERGLLGDLDGARVLDIGCGSGRNSRWFAEQGATVEGIDLAAPLLESARPTMPDWVNLTATDVLRDPAAGRAVRLVYDSGCFHHIAPHRRITYLDRVLPTVREGGRFGIVTFAAGRMQTPSRPGVVTSRDTDGGMAFPRIEDLQPLFDRPSSPRTPRCALRPQRHLRTRLPQRGPLQQHSKRSTTR